MALRDAQYDEIMSQYYQRQIENKQLAQLRREEIYKKIPRISQIDQIIASSSIDAVRNRLKNMSPGKDCTVATKEQNQQLIAEKEALLKSHGYATDYLKPIYTCRECQDTGRVGNTYCSCFKQSVVRFLYKQSTLDQVLASENFEHFDLSYYPKQMDHRTDSPYENMRIILDKTKQYVEHFDSEGGNLLFYGETGLGKTFLSNCVAKALLDSGHTVLYQTAIHLFEDVCGDVIMKKSQNPNSKEIYRYLYSCDLLIIDDLGTEFTNSFVSSELYDILNTRMREHKATLISTNLNMQELLERYEERIATRIFAEYKVFHFFGDNIRLAKRRNAIQQNK